MLLAELDQSLQPVREYDRDEVQGDCGGEYLGKVRLEDLRALVLIVHGQLV